MIRHFVSHGNPSSPKQKKPPHQKCPQQIPQWVFPIVGPHFFPGNNSSNSRGFLPHLRFFQINTSPHLAFLTSPCLPILYRSSPAAGRVVLRRASCVISSTDWLDGDTRDRKASVNSRRGSDYSRRGRWLCTLVMISVLDILFFMGGFRLFPEG